jgi:Tol biopolymer transport system component
MRRLLLVLIPSAALVIAGTGLSAKVEDGLAPTGRIAFAYRFWPEDPRITDNYEIFVMDAAKGTSSNLTRFPRCSEVAPAWSRSGRWLAFSCEYGPFAGIGIVRNDGAKRWRVLRSTKHGQWGEPAWAPDGRRLAVTGALGIWTVNADGSRLRQLTGRSDGWPTWSPDGSAIAFVRAVRGKAVIMRMRPDGRGRRLLASNASSPEWSPDGRHLAFVRGNWVWVMNTDGSGQHRLPGSTTGNVVDIAWSPDSRYLAYYVYCCRESGIYVMAADGSSRRRLSFGSEFQGISWGRNR